jgi:hypothetical protein
MCILFHAFVYALVFILLSHVVVSSASKRNRQATTTWLSSSSETTTGGMQELTAKEQRKADEANAAFERELRGDFDHRNNENEDQSNQHAGGGSRIRDEVAHALEESTGWANPSAVEAEMVWSRLEAHFERHHMDVSVASGFDLPFASHTNSRGQHCLSFPFFYYSNNRNPVIVIDNTCIHAIFLFSCFLCTFAKPNSFPH